MASEPRARRHVRGAVAVFGSSETRPEEPAYRTARRVGELLARAGHPVLTGGYGGVMEAASRGAREAGGRAIGVPCAIFSDREPNGWLSERLPSRDLYERTRLLIERACGFIVLPGKAGTLAELSMLWALQRAGCLGPRPVVLLGDGFEGLVGYLERSDMLEPEQVRRTRIADSPESACGMLDAWLAEGPG